jgi:hypothetical protein
MSAYNHDPRVVSNGDGGFHVFERPGTYPIGVVCPGLFGGFVGLRTGEESSGPGFDTADEAIRSLIGEPR